MLCQNGHEVLLCQMPLFVKIYNSKMNPYLLFGFGLVLPVAYTVGPRCVSYYLKLFLFYLSLLIVSSVVTPFLILRPSKVENMLIPAKIMNYVSQMLGLHWNITGLEKLLSLSGQSGVIVANHQFILDLLALFLLWPICRKMTVVAKSSLKYTGPFGLVAMKCGIIFIDRKKGKESHEIVQASLLDCKNEGTKVFVFPEGTRNHNPDKKDMLPFKTGAFAAAIGAQLPIIPMVISHYNFLDTNAKIFEPSNIHVRILDPISTKGLGSNDVDRLTQSVRAQMLEVFCSEEAHEPYQPPPKVDKEKTPLPNVARSL